jgi:hypothetical protein
MVTMTEKLYTSNETTKDFTEDYILQCYQDTVTGEIICPYNESSKDINQKPNPSNPQRTHFLEHCYKYDQCEEVSEPCSKFIIHHNIHDQETHLLNSEYMIAFNQSSKSPQNNNTNTREYSKRSGCNKHRKASDKSSNLSKNSGVNNAEVLSKYQETKTHFQWSEISGQNEKMHTRKKSYKCKEFSKFLFYPSQFIVNQNIHTADKPYKCRESDKAFCGSSSLTAHQRIHAGQKDYEYKLCGKSFAYSSKLVQPRISRETLQV